MYGRGFCACARIPFHTHLPSEARRERRSTFSSARMRTEGAKRARKAKHFLVSLYANRESEASEKGEALSRQPVCEQRERSERERRSVFSSACMRTERAKRGEKGEALSRQPVCEQRERDEKGEALSRVEE